jgi:hypothetical protein
MAMELVGVVAAVAKAIIKVIEQNKEVLEEQSVSILLLSLFLRLWDTSIS